MSRHDTEAYVTRIFKIRDNIREREKGTHGVYDKTINPLTIITASPGSGKSTFLVNFPVSSAYKNYCNGSSPIVSTFVFTKEMGFEDDLLGLRMIYGTLRPMRVLSERLTFEEFLNEVDPSSDKSKYKELTARDAVRILRNIFDSESVITPETKRRPLLFLVDEIKKSNNPKDVIRQLGNVLDENADVNILISSPSPGYMGELMGGYRPLEFVVIKPLLEGKLGSKECLEWVNTIIASAVQIDDTIKIDPSKLSILRNAYLLFSGHPRSLERMLNIMHGGSIDSHVIDNLLETRYTATSLLDLLVRKLYEALQYPNIVTLDEFEEYVLATPSLFEKGNVGFRKRVEEGSILIYDKVRTEYIICAPAISFLHKLQSKFFARNENAAYENCDTVYKLIDELMETEITLKPDSWLQRIVCFTIASRYYSRKPETYVLLGLEDSDVIRDTDQTLKITESKNISNIIDNIETDELLIPYHTTVGYNALLILQIEYTEQKAFFYLQMKLAPPSVVSDATLSDIVSSMIQNNLDHYLSENNRVLPVERKAEKNVLDNLHMVLYIWGLSDDELRNQVSQDMVLKKLKHKKTRKYVQDHWKQIHFVGTDTLKSWINPTMIPLVILFNEVQNILLKT